MRNFRKIITLGLLSSIIICISVVVKADNTISSTSTDLSQSSSSHFSASSSSNTNQSSTSNSPSSSSSPVLNSTSSSIVSQFIQSNNHPMGYAWKIQSNSANSIEPLSFVKLSSTVNAPANLSSNDPSLPRKDAVDISSAQSWMTQLDFDNLKKQGVKTAVIKLTEGVSYTNPYASSFIQMAKNSGLNIAVYHYARLGDTSDQATANSQAIAEAKYFVSVAESLKIPSNTAMILDCESPAVDINYVDWTIASQSWANEITSLGYSNLKYYTSQSWSSSGLNLMEDEKLGKSNMWLAQYLYGAPSSSNLQNISYGAWQYSSQMYYVGASQPQPIDTSIDYSNLFSPLPFTLIGMTWQNLSRTKVDFGIASSNYSGLTFTWKIYNLQTQQWSLVATSTSNWVTIDFPKSGSYLVYVEATNPQGQSSNYCIGWNIAPAFTLQGMTWVFHGSNVNTDFGIAYQSDEVLNFIWQIYDVQKNTWTTISNRSTSNWVNYNFPHQGNYLVHVTAISTSGDTASYDIGWQIN